jgi:hypothetical protein
VNGHEINFKFAKVVVGHCTAALEYACDQGAILIVNSSRRPFQELYADDGERLRQKWFDLAFELGLRSQLPVPFGVETIRLDDETLIIITEGNTRVRINFDELIVFDFERTVGFGVEEEVLNYKVYDLFDVRQGSLLQNPQVIVRDNSFFSRAVFYPSRRNPRNTDGHYKDIWVESMISAHDLDNFEFSSTMIKLLLEREIKANKITSDSGRPLKLEHSHRQIYKNDVEYKMINSLDKRVIIGHHLGSA